MKHQINHESIRSHIIYSREHRRFEFRIIPNQKSKLDIDYYPLITPRSIHDLQDHVVKTITKLVISELNRLPDEGLTAMQTILVDEVTDIPKKAYHLYDRRGRSLGSIYTSASDDLILNEVLLTWQKRAYQYEEV